MIIINETEKDLKKELKIILEKYIKELEKENLYFIETKKHIQLIAKMLNDKELIEKVKYLNLNVAKSILKDNKYFL